MTGPAQDLAAVKAAARARALARRAEARRDAPADPAQALRGALVPHLGRPLAGYMAMRDEIDPISAMAQAAEAGPVGVPVIEGRGRPLTFHRWRSDAPMRPGPFGARVPQEGEAMEPQVLIVPLLAFDRRGMRLGYGGGFYDRTLAALRARGPVLAVGFAFAAQEVEAVPIEETDQPLDLIVTERGVLPVER
ncbi:MAG: 5-formyltetrahydrofolate cyclo-ligase [Tranquillimonas sp.]|jgi:5-formyltetrahydrofolate cyclo-ligase